MKKLEIMQAKQNGVLQKQEKELTRLEHELKKTKKSLCDCRDQLRDTKVSAKYQRLRRTNIKLQKLKKTVEEKEVNLQKKINDKPVDALNLKIKSRSKSMYKQRQLVNYHKAQGRDVLREIAELKRRIVELEAELLCVNSETLETKVSDYSASNRFMYTDDVEKCVMHLVGELDIATNKCTAVIQTVSKWLQHKDISLTELPSTSTVQNMLDRAQYLSKIQVAESIFNADRWTLHSDGTTRDHNKVRVSSNGQMLSAGFASLAVEDSTTS